MKRNYKIGDQFKLSSDALENYGEEYSERVLTVQQWYDHVGRDEHGHPGFDSVGSALYASELPFDVYEWEMEGI